MSREPRGEADPHPSQDALIDFVLGYVEPARAAAIRAHVEGCAGCEAALRHAMGDRERARVRLASVSSLPALQTTRPLRTRAMRGLAIVAACAAGFIAIFALLPRGPSLQPAWLPTGVALESRGHGATETDAQVWRGLEAYQRHDLTGAIDTLSHTVASDPGVESLRRVHLASAWMLRGDARRALDALGDLDIGQLPHPWREEMRWVRACALSREGHAREAHDELVRLAAESGEAAVRARRALGSEGR
jgi:hypothetical protein